MLWRNAAAFSSLLALFPHVGNAQLDHCNAAASTLERAICSTPLLAEYSRLTEESVEMARAAGLSADALQRVEEQFANRSAECEGVLCWGRAMSAADRERRSLARLPAKDWLGYLSALEDLSAGKNPSEVTLQLGSSGWGCEAKDFQFTCTNAIGRNFSPPNEAEVTAKAKQTLIQLGCAEGAIDDELTEETISCYNSLLGITASELRPEDLAALSQSFFASNRDDALRQLMARGIVLKDPVGSASPKIAFGLPSMLGSPPIFSQPQKQPRVVPPKPEAATASTTTAQANAAPARHRAPLERYAAAGPAEPLDSEGRFVPGRPFADQLSEMAERHNVAEGEVSAALFDGRIAPHLEDLIQILREIDARPCDELLTDSRFAGWRPDRFDCERSRPWSDIAQEAWNARYGLPPRDQRFRYVRRQLRPAVTGYPRIDSDMSEEIILASRHREKYLQMWDDLSETPAPFYFFLGSVNDPIGDWANLYRRHREAFVKRDKYRNQDGTTNVEAAEQDRIEAEISAAIARSFSMREPNRDDILAAYERRRLQLGVDGLLKIRSLEKRGHCIILADAVPYTVLCNVRMMMDVTSGIALFDRMSELIDTLPQPYIWAQLQRPADEPIWTIVDFWDSCAVSEDKTARCSGRR